MASPGVSEAQSAVVNDSPVDCQSRRPGAPQSTSWHKNGHFGTHFVTDVDCGQKCCDTVQLSDVGMGNPLASLKVIPQIKLPPAFHIRPFGAPSPREKVERLRR